MAGSAVIGALRVNLGIDSAQFKNGLKNAQSGLSRFGKVARRGMFAASAAATAAGAAISLAFKHSIDSADELSKTAQKIGVPIEELSKLKYAADLSGVSLAGLQTGTARLAKNMNDAAQGLGVGKRAFDQLGISATNSDGTLKTLTQVMGEIGDKFATMPDGAAKTALAMDLMGRSGTDLIPLLNGGTAGLKAMTDEAESLGLVIDAKTGRAAEQFNDNISRLQQTIGGLVTQMTAQLAPILATITDKVVAWSAQFRSLSPQTQKFIGIVAGLTAAFAALAIPLGAVVLSVGLIGAPVVAAGVAIAGATAAVVAFWPEIRTLGETVAAFVSGAWADFSTGWDELVLKVDGLKQALIDLGTAGLEAIKAMVTGIVDWLGNRLSGALDSVTSKIVGVKDTFFNLYDAVVGHSYIPDMVTEIGQWMAKLDQNMVEPAQAAASGAADAFKSAGTEANGFFDSIGSSIGEAIKGTKEWSDVLKDILSQIAKIALSKLDFGGGGGGGFGGLISGLFGSLFGFAKGGTIMPGGAGGIDSQLVAFRKSPNERVDITKPGQTIGNGPQEIVITGTFVDDNGVISAQVRQMGRQAAQTGAAVAVAQVKSGFTNMLVNSQSREL